MQIEVTRLQQTCQTHQVWNVADGATIKVVLEQLGIQLQKNEAIGVFGELKSLDYCLQADDRLEIYSPLLVDPKDKRFQKLKGKIWQGTKKRRDHASV